MNISIIGTGYVGLVTGACFAEYGMNVLCMDINKEKIDNLQMGLLPIYEPELSDLITRNHPDRLNFTTSIKEAVDFSNVIFIAVNTPTLEDGTSDLTNVFQAVRDIALYMREYKVIVTKSTVPVFTGQQVKNEISAILEEQHKNIQFDVVSNPEFLQEGSAVNNFISPDRLVIGYESQRALELMERVYKVHLLEGVPFIATSIETAEMAKYASNAFLATKISFINEISNLCERCDADVAIVIKVMNLDDRIGFRYLSPGPGFGGSLPKDVKALIHLGKKMRYKPKVISSVLDTNKRQIRLAFQKIRNTLKKLNDKTVTLLGIAFKPGTDDIREAPSIDIITMLLKRKATVKAFDPKAMDNARKSYPDLAVEYSEDLYSACSGSDCIVLVTEWDEFKNLDFQSLKSIVHERNFIDLRNVYEPEYVKSMGFYYEGFGRK